MFRLGPIKWPDHLSGSIAGRTVGYTEIDAVSIATFRIVRQQPKRKFLPISSTLSDTVGATHSRVLVGWRRLRLPSAELAAAIVLQRLGTIVIMEACKLSSRQRVATTACDVLPAPGIVG
jgi:hypothetical protein